ncbi:MAG: hypothetical protein ACOCWW_01025 [Bacteroidota bacterium]
MNNSLLNNSVLFAKESDAVSLLIKQLSNSESDISLEEQQMDFSNKTIINQSGNNHFTHLNQNGSGNEARLLSEGGFTKMKITQTGNNNSIFSNISNNTLQLYSTLLEQSGDGNNIELTLLGNNVNSDIERAVSVRQTGNDLKFSGTYDSPDLPVKIEQKSGINGEGMDVKVTTSSFYFPEN